MKKIFLLFISMLLLTGCGKVSKDKLVDDFTKKVENANSYKLNGSLEIYNNLFKVDMINTNNDNEQIILRDKEAVYVVTPSLNKSYKFVSEWPFNSSQSYILNSLVKDIKEDNEIEYLTIDDYYVLQVDVNYPNNSYLKYEKIMFDKNMNLKKVIVYDSEDIESIKVEFNNISYDEKVDDNEFNIDSILDDKCCSVVEENTANMSDIIYPLYVPGETYLQSKDVVNTDNGERVILTFSGERNFVLIEEASNVYSEFETIPVYGDLLIMNDTIGALSNNSLSWSVNNRDYYLASNDLSPEEAKSIAESLNTTVYLEK